MYLSFQFQLNPKERVICEFKIEFKKSCLNSGLNSIPIAALKTGMDLRGWV